MKEQENDPITTYYGIGVENVEQVPIPPSQRRLWHSTRLRRLLQWVGSILIVAILFGGFYYLYTIGNPRTDGLRALKVTIITPVGLLGILVLILAILILRWIKPERRGFFTDMSTELISFAITVLALGVLVQWQSIEQQKEILIRDLGGRSNDFALRAARELRAESWLLDGSVTNADLKDANLTNANLWRADLTGAVLRRANLINADLQNADLTGANLRRADLTQAHLQKATLTNAFLIGATLTNANLEGATLTNAFYDRDTTWPDTYPYKTSGAISVGPGVNLAGKSLIDAPLNSMTLTGADLSRADLTQAHLQNATLTNALLVDANLTDADLIGANLTNANLGGATLTNALYDSKTIWPEGFAPKAAGAINVDEQEEEAGNDL